MRLFRDAPDERLIEVCEAFLEGTPSDPNYASKTTNSSRLRNTTQLADDLNARWKSAGIDLEITREQIYFILTEARRRGLFRIVPRLHDELRKQLCARYSIPLDRVHVVATESHRPEHVAYTAARLVVSQIFELWPLLRSRGKDRIHLGFGAGYTTRDVAFELAKLLREEERELPPLTLHAISSGYKELTTPLAFFGFFEDVVPEVELVGLFAKPFVAHHEFEKTMTQFGTESAFNRRHEIDIVVTSLGSSEDDHSSLKLHMEEVGFDQATEEVLEENDWKGDFHLRPFNEHGPIVENKGNRAVALFEISDFVTMARDPAKRVVVVSPPCLECGYTRGAALQLLLTVDRLKAWTHLVTDVPTARELIARASGTSTARVKTHTVEALARSTAPSGPSKARSSTAAKASGRAVSAAGKGKRSRES
jgi:hypothetical protein